MATNQERGILELSMVQTDWHETDIRVRFAETDIYGLVHHSNFFVWFEIGRIEYLRRQGFTLEDFSLGGVSLVLKSCSCETRASIRNDEEVVVRTQLVEVTPVKIVFRYEVARKNTGEITVTGESTNVFVGTDGKVRRIKPEMLSRLSRVPV